jgi:Ca2+-binding EF-hand superfamily protein
MPPIATERVENTQPSTEAKAVLNVQISEGDNKQLVALNQSQQEQLKAAGVLPELSITGGTELDYVRNNFDKLDKSKDGHVTKQEIEEYIAKNKTLSEAEKATLQKVAANVGKLENNNKDAEMIANGDSVSYGPEGGITKKDVEVANQRMKAEDYANKNFDKLDKDNNGHVNADEIKAYMKANEGKLSKDEQKTLETLAKDMDRLQGMNNDEWFFENDGFTRHDLVEARQQEGTQSVKIAEKNFAYKTAPEETKGERPGDKGRSEGAEKEKTVTVKPGDSLWKICREELKQRNGGQDPSNKDVLKMVHEMAAKNKMPLDGLIKPGDTLKVPGKTRPETGCEVPPVKVPPKAEPVREAPRQKPPVRSEVPGCEVPPPPPVKKEEPGCEVPPQRKPELKKNPGRTEPRPESERVDEGRTAAEIMRSRFSEIDKDGNNHVNKKEIERYLAENQGNLTADETRALDTMAKNVGKLQELANDERGDENSGISRQDLKKLDDLERTSEKILKSGQFNAIDSDRNNYLSKEEITKALTTARLTREERVTLEFLKDNMKYLQKGNNDERGFENNGVSQADLRFYAGIL